MSTSDFRKQRRNANKHTEKGMGLLRDAVTANGWIGAITVAADGETFDGSARLETVEALDMPEPIVVDSDGTRPIIVRRTDIPTADDPRAVLLGLGANQIAAENLAWDATALEEALALVSTDMPSLAAMCDELAQAAGVVPEDAPDVDFKEYGEDTADDVKYCECPNCGHKFPK